MGRLKAGWKILGWGLGALVVLSTAFAQEPAPERPVITSGCELDYPPFCMVHEDGRVDGFSVELMRAALAAIDHDVSFRTGPWAEVKGWLENGEIEALPLVGRTPERDELFDFTVPYLTMHGAIVVRQNTEGIHTLADLRGRRVGVMAGDNAEEFLRREDRGMEIMTTPTFSDALRALSAGNCDAVVMQRLVAMRLLRETGLTSLRLLDRPISQFAQDFCFAVREGDRETLALLNEGLALMFADGTHRRLHAKWFAHLELPDDRPLMIGGDRNYPPFEFLNEHGKPTGFNTDLTYAVAKASGLEVTVQLGEWTERRNALEDNRIDALQGMFYSTGREQVFDFSPSYLVLHYVAVVREGSTPPTSLDQLTEWKLVAEAGDFIHDFAEEKGILLANLTTVVDQEAALRLVVQGEQDCALVTRFTALHLIEKHGWNNLVIGTTPILSPTYSYAVPHGQAALLAKFSEGLSAVKASGEYQRIYDKWLSTYDTGMSSQDVLAYVLWGGVPLLICVALALLWSWSLKRQVRQRTADLHKSTEFQQAMIACSPVALLTVDLKGNALTWNTSCERIFGWKAGEVIGKPLPIVPDDKQQEYKEHREQVAGGEPFTGKEVERQHKDGSLLPISLSVAPLRNEQGEMIGIMGVAEDISQRKLHEARLDHLTRVLRAIRDVNQLITHETDRDVLIRRACEILIGTRGYRSAWIVINDRDGKFHSAVEAGVGEGFAEIRHDLEAGKLPLCCQLALGDEGLQVIHDTNINCVDCPLAHNYRENAALAGALRYGDIDYGAIVVALPAEMTNDDQEQSLFLELAGDIAYALHSIEQEVQREEAEHALRESEARFRLLAETAPIGIVISDENGQTIHINQRFVDLFGYTIDDMPTVDAWWLLAYPSEELRRDVQQAWQAAMEKAQRNGADMPLLEYPVTCKNGTMRQVEFRLASRQGLNFIILTDVTERRETESQLRQAQKLDSVGRLAGGVAHDFNNMLTIIMGQTQMMLMRMDDQDPKRRQAMEIQKAAERSANLTRQLLAFARKQTIKPVVLDLNTAIEELLKMLRRLIGEDIELIWRPGKQVSCVEIDPTQVDQMLVNLCVNARDAIQGVGTLTIQTSNFQPDASFCVHQPEFDLLDYVRLTVSDNGCGIAPDNLEMIFEPFFTTKDTGEGTGLGLATVFGIVKQNHGHIQVESKPGTGATFNIYFPAAKRATADRSGKAPAESATASDHETILIAEDEAGILAMTTDILTELGYQVLPANGPEQARQMAETHEGTIDLLLTDVIMPKMNGKELADLLRQRMPSLKVIFMSGYTSDVIASRGLIGDDVHFIQKPFSVADLGAKLREVLTS